MYTFYEKIGITTKKIIDDLLETNKFGYFNIEFK
jgi:hypothetical protein